MKATTKASNSSNRYIVVIVFGVYILETQSIVNAAMT
jgi:hypothetical protein